jgi:hypothetical protein
VQRSYHTKHHTRPHRIITRITVTRSIHPSIHPSLIFNYACVQYNANMFPSIFIYSISSHISILFLSSYISPSTLSHYITSSITQLHFISPLGLFLEIFYAKSSPFLLLAVVLNRDETICSCIHMYNTKNLDVLPSWTKTSSPFTRRIS